MIISISGTHCTGKTTLVEALKNDPRLQGVIFLKSSGRELIENNPQLKINEDGNFLSQMYILCRDIKQEIENCTKPVVICDRCCYDTLIYSYHLYITGKLKEEEWEVLEDMVVHNPVLFDRHFLLTPSFELQDEVNRSMNKQYQKEIQDLFEEFWGRKFLSCQYLTDTLEGRVETIVNYIEKSL